MSLILRVAIQEMANADKRWTLKIKAEMRSK